MEKLKRLTNIEVAAILYEVAGLLEIKGVRFSPYAYRRAAQAIETLPEDIADLAREGRLGEIPGVGKGIAGRIMEIIETGGLGYLESLREDPGRCAGLTRIEGSGRRGRFSSPGLGIQGIDDLEAAATAGRIRDLPGFGEKSEVNILAGIRMRRMAGKRHLLGYILPTARDIERRLSSLESVGRVSLAGSVRRRKETIGDVDILATSTHPGEVMEAFVALPGVSRILARGTTKTSVVLTTGIQVDLRVVDDAHYGAALQYFTGSKEHNIALRRLAIARNWRLNEYGLVDLADGRQIAGEDEAGVYQALELAWIPPGSGGSRRSRLHGTMPCRIR